MQQARSRPPNSYSSGSRNVALLPCSPRSLISFPRNAPTIQPAEQCFDWQPRVNWRKSRLPSWLRKWRNGQPTAHIGHPSDVNWKCSDGSSRSFSTAAPANKSGAKDFLTSARETTLSGETFLTAARARYTGKETFLTLGRDQGPKRTCPPAHRSGPNRGDRTHHCPPFWSCDSVDWITESFIARGLD